MSDKPGSGDASGSGSGSGDGSGDASRQRIVRVVGARRARLTPIPGALGDSDAEATLRGDEPPAPPADDRGPNDDRLRRDVPPHY
ncbi:hypothetical protein [Microbacterium album]|uniref:Uncharacterized protein n=1 Tax=Microbacterium album TaxID=2053191 RepID=A0A917IHA7_9MICO|nr:hypothetical protein [Microbacterium album]GGH43990.1 hypothetical protein GCM10010921_18350 [Microbacterium album]